MTRGDNFLMFLVASLSASRKCRVVVARGSGFVWVCDVASQPLQFSHPNSHQPSPAHTAQHQPKVSGATYSPLPIHTPQTTTITTEHNLTILLVALALIDRIQQHSCRCWDYTHPHTARNGASSRAHR
jgi:hypothetical protein